MAQLNSVYLRGNLTRDPEKKFLPSGSPVVTFGFAVNRRYRSVAHREVRTEGMPQDMHPVWYTRPTHRPLHGSLNHLLRKRFTVALQDARTAEVSMLSKCCL